MPATPVTPVGAPGAVAGRTHRAKPSDAVPLVHADWLQNPAKLPPTYTWRPATATADATPALGLPADPEYTPPLRPDQALPSQAATPRVPCPLPPTCPATKAVVSDAARPLAEAKTDHVPTLLQADPSHWRT